MGDALHLVEALSVERGALQERALSVGAGVENLAEIAQHNDALLDRAEQSLRAAGLPVDPATRARDILVAARTRVADGITRPLAERDPNLVPAILAQLYERLDAVEAAVTLAEQKVTAASASVGRLVAVGSLAVDMRAIAGRRSSHLSGWFGGRPFSRTQADEVMYLTGKLQQTWDQLRQQVVVLGDPPSLSTAVAETHDRFFTKAEPVYRDLVDVARAGDKPPLTLPDWRRWTIAALPGTLPARDAAIAEAITHGQRLAEAERMRLAVAVTATAAALTLAAAALFVLLRSLIHPIQRLTAAVAQLASGNIEATVPGLGRGDEIGAMAAAVEVFRKNALDLRQINLRFAAALENMSHGLAMYDAEERLIVTNPQLCTILGLPIGSLVPGMTFTEILAIRIAAGHYPGRSVDEIYIERRHTFKSVEPSCIEEVIDGRTIEIASQPMVGGGCVLTVEDITERRAAEAHITFMAHHDALTGLPNRVLLRSRLSDAIARASRDELCVVLYLDLDRFKEVNDTLGHPAGDALLQSVARRLAAELRQTDFVARLGGDEFAIIQAGAEKSTDVAALAQRLVRALAQPFDLDGHQVVIGTSIGIAVAPADGNDPDALLKAADLALYRSKENGRGSWSFFEHGMDTRMLARRSLEMGLRRAVAMEEFELHYQAIVDLASGVVSGFEALVRWRHPERGMVQPNDFIHLAEEIGLIVPLGAWVLQRACADAASWAFPLKVAVNLSPVQLGGSGPLSAVSAALAISGLDPSRLELEITETAMLTDTASTLVKLKELKELGISIAMDDFGTGYSSLSYLRQFPFDRVKIDRSFVQGLGKCAKSTATFKAVVDLCAAMGMAITAEGVEAEAQLMALQSISGMQAQGYLFSRPRPAADVPQLCRELGVGAEVHHKAVFRVLG
ncbi:putative bifunctional diguanylate cyclase/phosphodiesterase [Belnapia moabensis]|uniref:putative bifunctional diguanylate cyclase/phosphodiesterase n=1 Tax=Belnapia moabensis TaxID=365533 RepID=UPI000693C50F|nr:EAL domain-containing protein [Belnapia moabensis]